MRVQMTLGCTILGVGLGQVWKGLGDSPRVVYDIEVSRDMGLDPSLVSCQTRGLLTAFKQSDML